MKITIEECISTAARTPLATGADWKEFQQNLLFLYEERDDEWLKAAVPRYLAQAMIGAMALAQRAGIAPEQIRIAIETELVRHKKAIEAYVPPMSGPDQTAAGEARAVITMPPIDPDLIKRIVLEAWKSQGNE